MVDPTRSKREALRIENAASSLREQLAIIEPPTSAARSAGDAIHQLGLAIIGNAESEHIFQATYLVALAEGLATVPETADERVSPPAFLSQSEFFSFPSRVPQGLTPTQREEWVRWQSAHNAAVRTRHTRLQTTHTATATMCDIYRDVIPYPFEPVMFDPTWRTTTAVALARGMVETLNFDVLPILADALQDAGCEERESLNHCHTPGTHVRGCWVIQSVLGTL